MVESDPVVSVTGLSAVVDSTMNSMGEMFGQQSSSLGIKVSCTDMSAIESPLSISRDAGSVKSDSSKD